MAVCTASRRSLASFLESRQTSFEASQFAASGGARVAAAQLGSFPAEDEHATPPLASQSDESSEGWPLLSIFLGGFFTMNRMTLSVCR